MEVEVREHYKNLQTLIGSHAFVFAVCSLVYLTSRLPITYLVYILLLSMFVVLGIYLSFENYDKKIGKKVFIFEDEELIKARRKAPDKLRYIIKPVRYEQIQRIEIRSRYFKFYYERNGKEQWSMLPLKAVFMDEDERRRRERILEELLSRVKKANPDVKIIDKRRRKKKVK